MDVEFGDHLVEFMCGSLLMLDFLFEDIDVVIAFFDDTCHQESFLEEAIEHKTVLGGPVAQ